jgi:hypothetical protein
MLLNRFLSRGPRPGTLVATCLALASMFFFGAPCISAQHLPPGIGIIEGDHVEVKTPVGGGIESHFSPTVVASGSVVTLSEGDGLILLDGGGEISICGPAHFTLLKSGEDVTLALDYGRVHPSIDVSTSLTIFTPVVVATPVAIAGARRNSTIGLDQNGVMCIITDRGAMRIQQQLSDQNLVIPQGDMVNLIDGQVELLDTKASSCSCEFKRPSATVTSSVPKDEVAALNPPLEPERRQLDAEPTPPAAITPAYTITLPALSFDASSSSPVPPPEPRPESMLLVREVRVHPDVEFHGRVSLVNVSTPPQTAADPISRATRPPQVTKSPGKKSGVGFFERIREFFRNL